MTVYIEQETDAPVIIEQHFAFLKELESIPEFKRIEISGAFLKKITKAYWDALDGWDNQADIAHRRKLKIESLQKK